MPAKPPTINDWRTLYAAAAAFINAKCWEHVDSDHIFGVRPAPGETYYCGILGYYHDTYGFAVYQEPPDFLRLRQDNGDDGDVFYELRGIIMYLGPKAGLDAEDRRVTEQIGFTPGMRGKWPLFRSMCPGFHPWYLEWDEARIMTVCLTQAVAVAARSAVKHNLLARDRRERILIRAAAPDEAGSAWNGLRESMPPAVETKDPGPMPVLNQFKLRRVANITRQRWGRWEADYFFAPAPLRDAENVRPYYPYYILIIDGETGIIIGQKIARHAEVHTDLAELMLDVMIQTGSIPRQLLARRMEVSAALAPILQELGIQMEMVKNLEIMDLARRDLQEFMREGRF